MTHIYHRIFDEFRILDAEDISRADDFAGSARWLDAPGCLFQANNFVLDGGLRTEGAVKAGLFVTIVLKGAGHGGPRLGAKRFRYSENSIVVMALREPAACGGEAPDGTHMSAASLAFPKASIERLGLQREFLGLFARNGGDAFVATLKAPPRPAGYLDSPDVTRRFTYIMLKLHTDMFAGCPESCFWA